MDTGTAEPIVFLDGDFVAESAARVPVMDRGFNGGEGVYDVTRTYRHQPFMLEEHVGRLFRSLRYARIDCGYSPAEIERFSREVLARNRHFMGPEDDCVIWQVISRGVLHAGFTRRAPKRPTVAIYCLPVSFAAFARDYLDGVTMVIPATRRTPPECVDAKAKLTNKMNHSVAGIEARLVDPRAEPLMLDIHGNIAETQIGNFFFVNQGKLCTAGRNVLGGITRQAIIDLARSLGIETIEGDFTPYDVLTADEAFTSSTSPTIGPVKSVNGVAIGKGLPGPITLKLIKAWSAKVGVDIVAQALSHIEDGTEKQRALGAWAKLRG